MWASFSSGPQIALLEREREGTGGDALTALEYFVGWRSHLEDYWLALWMVTRQTWFSSQLSLFYKIEMY
jgi:hypothetical protein